MSGAVIATGQTSDGYLKPLRVDSDGKLVLAADVVVEADLDALEGPIGTKAAGTAGTTSQLVGLVFNTSLPAPTDGQQMALQANAAGMLVIGGRIADDADSSGSTAYPLPVGGRYNTTLPTYTNGDRTQWQADVNGAVRSVGVAASLTGADGQSNTIAGLLAQNSVSTTRPLGVAGYVLNGSTWDRVVKPNASGRLLSAANTTNATVVKAAAGNLRRISGWNAGTVTYLKIYNKATTPDENDTPIFTEYLPASARFEMQYADHYFSAGISYRLVTGGPDNDTGAVAAAAILAMNVSYS